MISVRSKIALGSQCHLQPFHFFINSSRSQCCMGVKSQTLKSDSLSVSLTLLWTSSEALISFLSFFICKMEIIIGFNSWYCYED